MLHCLQAKGGISCTWGAEPHSESQFRSSYVTKWLWKYVFGTEWVQDAAWPNVSTCELTFLCLLLYFSFLVLCILWSFL